MDEEILELHASDYFKGGEQVYIHIDRAESKYVGVMHKHDFIEIVYIISGSARHCIGDSIYEVHKGDLVIVNYGVEHTFTLPMRMRTTTMRMRTRITTTRTTVIMKSSAPLAVK